MGLLYVGLTILFTVYGQIIIKWQIRHAGELPASLSGKFTFLLSQFGNLWIISGFAAAFLASLVWMAAMTKLELSFAYPFMSLSFVLVVALSLVLFDEIFSWYKVVGMGIIILGLFVFSR
jgi:multidrug transporter EmrE-like cation transporter